MIPENYSPAIAALNIPLSVEDAAARISDYTAAEERNISGLIGLCFYDLDQFLKGMKECGWDVELPEYMKSQSAITWIGMGVAHVGIKRQERYMKLILHSFGSHVQVINCIPENDEPKELGVRAETPRTFLPPKTWAEDFEKLRSEK